MWRVILSKINHILQEIVQNKIIFIVNTVCDSYWVKLKFALNVLFFYVSINKEIRFFLTVHESAT